MQILKPLGNLKAEQVKSWKQIKEEALELKKFLSDKNFTGNWEDAFAISHVQVSLEPKNFFVVNKKMVKTFGHWCIVNLKIKKTYIPVMFEEGCMSFMYRKTKDVPRWKKVTVTYWTPFMNLFLIPRRKTFTEAAAFICQHEDDHAKGINIYGI